jgi:hypothetical protein
MLVFEYYTDDNNEKLKDLQFAMYSYSISTIIGEVERIYMDNPYTELYLSAADIEQVKSIKHHDHRLIQGAHDILAAVFRYKAREGEFEKELFDGGNEEIKQYFEFIYVDLDFFEKIPVDLWFLTIKWHEFIIENIKENIPLVHELLNAVIKFYSGPGTNKNQWEAAHNAVEIIKEKYSGIPWKNSRIAENEQQ